LFVTIALTGLAGGAAFADYAYTFKVPVTVSNLPPGAILQISCGLYSGSNGTGKTVASVLGGGPTVTNGSYSGTVTIATSAPTAPGSYACQLFISLGSNHINFAGGTYTPQPGWTGTMSVTGNVP
jgi:hypothetical protein